LQLAIVTMPFLLKTCSRMTKIGQKCSFWHTFSLLESWFQTVQFIPRCQINHIYCTNYRANCGLINMTLWHSLVWQLASSKTDICFSFEKFAYSEHIWHFAQNVIFCFPHKMSFSTFLPQFAFSEQGRILCQNVQHKSLCFISVCPITPTILIFRITSA
jgi:hypothetical protein